MSTPAPAATLADVIDPVCGMTISPADAVGHAEYKGQTYYFCWDPRFAALHQQPGFQNLLRQMNLPK